MKLTAEREKLLAPLQAVIGVVERRQTMPVLANVLLGVGQFNLDSIEFRCRYRRPDCAGDRHHIAEGTSSVVIEEPM